jgi:hypothetical protein
MSAKVKNYPGEALESREIREGRVPTEKFRPKAKFAWSAGVAMSRFLEELKNGKIIASTCSKCGRVIVPPRIYCEKCYTSTDGWRYVKDTGTINTFSVPFLAADATRLKEPEIVAIINLDGASEDMGIIHKIGDVKDWKTVKIGMRVKAVWKTPKERTGAITDIKHFKPLREG